MDSIAYKIGVANLLAGAAGAALIAYFAGSHAALAFVIGLGIAAVNIFWLLRIVKKGLRLTPDMAARLVGRSYYLRFAATVFVMVVLIAKGFVSPWPLVAGFTVVITVSIVTMIFAAYKEVF